MLKGRQSLVRFNNRLTDEKVLGSKFKPHPPCSSDEGRKVGFMIQLQVQQYDTLSPRRAIRRRTQGVLRYNCGYNSVT